MAQPLATPFCYFTDANGAPLAGGKVYTYAAGTTTPLASYTDSTGTTPNANPVILDSQGRASIWLSGTYKIIVKDSADNQIGTPADNVTALSATGDMTKSVYDPANIIEQLVGLTAVQTLTNKTLTTPVINKGNLVGTTTSDNAAAGSVGEYISSTVLVGSAVSLTSGVGANVTSISLTAGDWDVSGNVVFNPAGTTTVSQIACAISQTSATFPTAPSGGSFSQVAATMTTGATQGLPAGMIRIPLGSTTTVYLVCSSTFGVSTMGAYGFIGARRRR